MRGEVLVVEDGPGEDAGDVGEVGVRGEADLADGAAALDVQDGDVLVGGAEGAFQAQPSLAAPQVVAAAVGVFDAVGELGGGPAGGGQQGAPGGRRPVRGGGAHVGAGHPQVRAEEELGGAQRVGGDLGQGAGPPQGAVGVAAQRDAELGAEQAQFADQPVAEQLLDAGVLGVVEEHEALHQQQAALAGEGHRLVRVREAGGERLLAQHVLAGLKRPQGPLHVQFGRQRQVDGVHVVALQQPGVAGHRGAAEPAGERPRLREAAAGDRGHLDERLAGHRGQHAPLGDVRAAQHPDPQHTRSWCAHGPVHRAYAPPRAQAARSALSRVRASMLR